MSRLLRLIAFALPLLLACQVHVATAQEREPSREPVLRIETGMHTAAIRHIGVDAANRYLVTASEDKTVRVWELPAGRLLRVIRPAIGAGNEGKLYAVAISPDGNTIAAAGWTSVDGLHESIYLFDRESGRLVRRLGGLPFPVAHLAYSPDGRYLAATLGGKHGVRVYQTSTYTLAGEDTDYGDKSNGADFDQSDRLATTSEDGFIRLYAPPAEGAGGRLRLIAKQSAAQGKQPYAVSFSPDGTRLAVGFIDSARVAVLSSRDLSASYAPDTSGVDNGNLGNVVWSADGRTLYAGGTAGIRDSFIRAWADGGRGGYRDTAAAADTIFHILPLRGGGVIYGTGDPAFGALDAAGRRTLFVTGAIADYRALQQGFLLAADGSGVGFAYELFGHSPARFSLSERRLEAGGASPAGWRAPVTEGPGLRVTDWEDNTEPKLNGTRLKLKPYEISRSLAIAPDASAFLLGADWYIRLFDRTGKEVWPKPVPAPGEAWAVNVSADGRLAVAAYGDGTIRWYSMKDGKELLAFFPHADRKRWVLWTPSGYYDASPGAEELIGWHVNNGRERAADFFPVGQFREKFYRPDVVARVLKTLDEQLALKEANEERGLREQQAKVEDLLPPVVDIVSPADGAQITPGEVTVRYRLRSPNGEPVTNVMAMVDGKTAAVERGLSLSVGGDGQEREIRISVPQGASLVSVLAMNRNAPSVASTVRVSTGPASRGSQMVGEKSNAPRPTLYILAVGVGKYADGSGLPRLTFPAKDAQDFAAALERQKGLSYQDVIPRVLPDATHDQIMDGLEWIGKATKENDVAMIFLAGHGITDGGDFYYFMPSDGELEHPKKRGVPFAEIENTLVSLKGQKILFVDTCRSGAVLGRRGVIDINGIANRLNRETSGVAVFTASMGNESAFEDSAWGNGAFTRALLDGLSGQADSEHSGEITFSMLDRFLTRRVRELTANRQTPTATKPLTVPDFLVAATR